jgi:hypothetical protein
MSNRDDFSSASKTPSGSVGAGNRTPSGASNPGGSAGSNNYTDSMGNPNAGGRANQTYNPTTSGVKKGVKTVTSMPSNIIRNLLGIGGKGPQAPAANSGIVAKTLAAINARRAQAGLPPISAPQPYDPLSSVQVPNQGFWDESYDPLSSVRQGVPSQGRSMIPGRNLPNPGGGYNPKTMWNTTPDAVINENITNMRKNSPAVNNWGPSNPGNAR